MDSQRDDALSLVKEMGESPDPVALEKQPYRRAGLFTRWLRGSHRAQIAREISRHSRYFDECFQVLPRLDDDGLLLQAIDCPKRRNLTSESELPPFDSKARPLILLNGVLNFHLDIEGLLGSLRPRLTRHTRITIVAYNPYLRWLYSLANRLGLRRGELPQTFLTRTDLKNLCTLANYELVRIRGASFVPLQIPFLTSFLEALIRLLPGGQNFALTSVITLRPILPDPKPPLLTVVIPARNERGNIENALKRMDNWQTEQGPVEVLFVEGNSDDDTWGEIQRVLPIYRHRFHRLLAFRQPGKGKSDAVREGFRHAEGEVLTILDADLTMPPEMLPRFYRAYVAGKADFVNGSRLLYPMEGEAMRPLNLLGNVFFAKALSFVLDNPLGDSLCGTKLFTRRDYERFVQWRTDFGDFDPFGDFELLFPASILALGTAEVPVHYKARTYGTTNISRFRHGFMLLKMTLIGLFRVKLR